MSLYAALYILVNAETLLEGLPQLAELEDLKTGDSPYSSAWKGDMGEMMDSGYVWFSLSEFAHELPRRIRWLRSVAPIDERLDSDGFETDGTRCLAFQLRKDDQFLHVSLTNWMQLALPEEFRGQCLMARVNYDSSGGNYKSWLPARHPVMPLLIEFLGVVRPLYGKTLFSIGSPFQHYVEEDRSAQESWNQLWRKVISCGFFGTDLVRVLQLGFDILDPASGLAHVINVPHAGVWFTEPGDWQTERDPISLEHQRHDAACLNLFEVLQTIPDSAVFPGADPLLTLAR